MDMFWGLHCTFLIGYLACFIPSAKEACCFCMASYDLTKKAVFIYPCKDPCVISVLSCTCCDAAVDCEIRVLRIFKDQILGLILLIDMSIYSSRF